MSFFSEYKKSLKVIEAEDVFDLIFFRPLGYIFMRTIYNTSITPNQISAISGIFGLLSGILLIFRNRNELVLISIVLLILSMILDCADGQLARAKKNGTKFGHLVDALFDYITYFALYIGIALNLQFTQNNPYLIITGGGAVWWIFIILSGISAMFQSLFVDGAKTLFINIVTGKTKDYFNEQINEYQEGLKQKKQEKAGFFKLFPYRIFLNYLKIQYKSLNFEKIDKDIFYKKNKYIMPFWSIAGPSAKLVLIMICAIFQRFDIFIWITLIPLNIILILLLLIQKLINKN